MALTNDTSMLTSVVNDCGFEEFFACQMRALALPGDVVLTISTSRNSPDVLLALVAAREKNLSTIGLTSRDGGKMRELVDHCICVPADPGSASRYLSLVCQFIESSVISD